MQEQVPCGQTRAQHEEQMKTCAQRRSDAAVSTGTGTGVNRYSWSIPRHSLLILSVWSSSVLSLPYSSTFLTREKQSREEKLGETDQPVSNNDQGELLGSLLKAQPGSAEKGRRGRSEGN